MRLLCHIVGIRQLLYHTFMEMDMKKNKFAAIFLLVALLVSLLCAPSASALTDPEVEAPNIVLAEASTGEILFTRNETARV